MKPSHNLGTIVGRSLHKRKEGCRRSCQDEAESWRPDLQQFLQDELARGQISVGKFSEAIDEEKNGLSELAPEPLKNWEFGQKIIFWKRLLRKRPFRYRQMDLRTEIVM